MFEISFYSGQIVDTIELDKDTVIKEIKSSFLMDIIRKDQKFFKIEIKVTIKDFAMR